jgi:undecaprenyl pyrophosphate synthase
MAKTGLAPSLTAPEKKATEPATSSKRVRVNVMLPEDLREDLRNAVYRLSGYPHHLTITAVVESALRKELKQILKAHPDAFPGGEITARDGALPIGRRAK